MSFHQKVNDAEEGSRGRAARAAGASRRDGAAGSVRRRLMGAPVAGRAWRPLGPEASAEPNQPLQPTGAALTPSRGMESPQAAPAAERGVRHSTLDRVLLLDH